MGKGKKQTTSGQAYKALKGEKRIDFEARLNGYGQARLRAFKSRLSSEKMLEKLP
ncbi:hypothetical protein [Arenibacter certesii]|uniref:Uncharacterized protein n=1 Tax=Arenibacter certesii TaxID=228955 RepID=A0A918ISZ8_9FLAO|nr:hypothetical protein [Arenibacter certesii]GGW30745.1 hypothetical protein GCM10007383_14960 [Arenibacter certesii]